LFSSVLFVLFISSSTDGPAACITPALTPMPVHNDPLRTALLETDRHSRFAHAARPFAFIPGSVHLRRAEDGLHTHNRPARRSPPAPTTEVAASLLVGGLSSFRWASLDLSRVRLGLDLDPSSTADSFIAPSLPEDTATDSAATSAAAAADFLVPCTCASFVPIPLYARSGQMLLQLSCHLSLSGLASGHPLSLSAYLPGYGLVRSSDVVWFFPPLDRRPPPPSASLSQDDPASVSSPHHRNHHGLRARGRRRRRREGRIGAAAFLTAPRKRQVRLHTPSSHSPSSARLPDWIAAEAQERDRRFPSARQMPALYRH
jgi:hypothetical protein